MKMDHHSVDPVAHALIKQVHSNEHTKVILVTHQAKENIWNHARTIAEYIPQDRLIFLFLSEHTYTAAIQLQRQLSLNYSLSFLYPVVPLRLLFTEDKSNEFESYYTDSIAKQNIFAVQGHFGGIHAKRRNVANTVSCLHNVSDNTRELHTKSEPTSEGSSYPRLNIVGHISGEFPMSKAKNSSVQVSITGELPPLEFYKAIAKSHYLVTSLGSDLYLHRQATSTIPTALILQMPIVTTTHLLRLYPCLRDAPLHRRFTQDTECASMRHVMKLSVQDYLLARDEIANCSVVLWEQAKQTMAALLQR